MQAAGERPITELFGQLARQSGELIQKEIRLARNEVAVSVLSAAEKAAGIGIGGALLNVGLMSLVAGAILGLGAVIPYWASALVIGVLLAGGGYVHARSSYKALAEQNFEPRRAIQSMKENRAWIAHQIEQ